MLPRHSCGKTLRDRLELCFDRRPAATVQPVLDRTHGNPVVHHLDLRGCAHQAAAVVECHDLRVGRERAAHERLECQHFERTPVHEQRGLDRGIRALAHHEASPLPATRAGLDVIDGGQPFRATVKQPLGNEVVITLSLIHI